MIIRLVLGEGKWLHLPKCLFYFEKHEQEQMKSIASIYGKTLWTLKNNLKVEWLLNIIGEPLKILAFKKAIDDFYSLPEWEPERKKIDFTMYYNKICSIIYDETREVN